MAKEACDYDFSDVGSVRAPTADHHKHHHPCLQIQYKDMIMNQKKKDSQVPEPKTEILLIFFFFGNKAEQRGCVGAEKRCD